MGCGSSTGGKAYLAEHGSEVRQYGELLTELGVTLEEGAVIVRKWAELSKGDPLIYFAAFAAGLGMKQSKFSLKMFACAAGTTDGIDGVLQAPLIPEQFIKTVVNTGARTHNGLQKLAFSLYCDRITGISVASVQARQLIHTGPRKQWPTLHEQPPRRPICTSSTCIASEPCSCGETVEPLFGHARTGKGSFTTPTICSSCRTQGPHHSRCLTIRRLASTRRTP